MELGVRTIRKEKPISPAFNSSTNLEKPWKRARLSKFEPFWKCDEQSRFNDTFCKSLPICFTTPAECDNMVSTKYILNCRPLT